MTCPACAAGTYHTQEEFKSFHPLAGHGFTREQGWTHPDAKIAHDAEVAAVEKSKAEQAAKQSEAKP